MYQNDTFDPLSKTLSIFLQVATKTFLSNFAGTGQRRKRSPTITMALATEISDKIYKNYWFFDGERRIGQIELAEHLTNAMWAIPDDLAKCCGSKLHDTRHPAIKEVADTLEKSLLEKWRMEFVSMDKQSSYYRG